MEAIPGFSPEDSEVIRQGIKAGALSDAQKQAVIDRATAAVDPSQQAGLVPEPAVDERPKNITEATGGLVTRGATEAALATGVGAMGTPLGPAGIIGGGALGASAGSITFDSNNALGRFFGVFQPDEKTKTQ